MHQYVAVTNPLTAIGARLRKALPKERFARGVGVLAGGTVAVQLLAVLVAPVITRLYTPADFGAVAVFAAVLAMIGVVSSLRYELAIPLPESDSVAASVLWLCVLILLGVSALTAVGVAMFGDVAAALLETPILAEFKWLLPIAVLLSGAYSIFNYWAIRQKSFARITATRLGQALFTVSMQMALFRWNAAGLLVASVVGQTIGTTSLARAALSSPVVRKLDWPGIGAAASRYRRFPVYSTWEGLANSVGLQAVPLLFAAMFGPAAAGLYALTSRVLSLPMSVVGGAIANVFLASAPDAHRDGRLAGLVAALHGKLAHFGLPPMLVLAIAGPELFQGAFGPNWREAGMFARWMAPWLYFVFVSSPLSTLFAVLEQQAQGLIFQIVLVVSRVAAIAAGAWIGDVLTAVALFSIVSAVCWCGFLIWVARLSGNPARTFIVPTLQAAWFGLACAFPLIAYLPFHALLDPTMWWVALGISMVLLALRSLHLARDLY